MKTSKKILSVLLSLTLALLTVACLGTVSFAADEIAANEITGNGRVSMTVDHISLMRSDRGKYGMIYTEL